MGEEEQNKRERGRREERKRGKESRGTTVLLIPMSRALEICLATVPVAPERERERRK